MKGIDKKAYLCWNGDDSISHPTVYRFLASDPETAAKKTLVSIFTKFIKRIEDFVLEKDGAISIIVSSKDGDMVRRYKITSDIKIEQET